MAYAIDHLEGRKLCVVFVKVVDPTTERVQLQCFHGRGSVDRGRLNVIDANGTVFPVPSSATGNVLPSDGTRILRDAEYFVLVKADKGIDFVSSN